jgi:hypothetical protein
MISGLLNHLDTHIYICTQDEPVLRPKKVTFLRPRAQQRRFRVLPPSLLASSFPAFSLMELTHTIIPRIVHQ